MKQELLIGCGNNRAKKLRHPDDPEEWSDLTTMDRDPDCNPDALWDLDVTPWCAQLMDRSLPLPENHFDEVHAYEVLEHIGQQGDWKAFFRHFGEIYRVLKPDGCLFATCPSWNSLWTWGDPSHTRVVSSGSIVFLDQKRYHEQVGVTAMSDFRHTWKGDFEIMHSEDDGESHRFMLKAKKPAREFESRSHRQYAISGTLDA